jgi:hypothetical protein
MKFLINFLFQKKGEKNWINKQAWLFNLQQKRKSHGLEKREKTSH